MTGEAMKIEVDTDHPCELGALTEQIAEWAREETGTPLSERAAEALRAMLGRGRFQTCCVPRYLELLHEDTDQETQVRVASNDHADLEARVLLWPPGAKDHEHPHRDGWALIEVVRGELTVTEIRGGERLPERPIRSQRLLPEEGVKHHVHNRSARVAVSVHLFGR